MEVLSNIPFSLDAASLMARLRIEPDSEDATVLEEFIRIAEAMGNPKAAYREAFVEARGDHFVRLGGVTFTSRMLSMNLASVERVFAYVATCGREVHEDSPAGDDFIEQFWWDAIKAELLGAASRHLSDHLRSRFRLGKTSTMSPGSADVAVWPIEQQRFLFKLIGDVRAKIGVELTDSSLMVPNKTVSGIRFPTEADFRSCQVCHRENCPSRSAPFDEELWKAAYQEGQPP